MELVFCIARKDLERVFAAPLPYGALAEPPLEAVLDLPHQFIARPEAEADPAYKQIIPYQLFHCQDRFLVYKRGSGVGEQRLSGRLSLGIGGHLNLADTSQGRMGPAGFAAGLARERNEELICQGDIETEFIGWINDDSDPVGRVHLGAVHLCTVREEKDVQIRHGAEDIHLVGWISPPGIRAWRQQFENWSLLALELAMR